MKNIAISIFFVCYFVFTINAQTTKKEIKIQSTDNVEVTGDLYLTASKTAPFIILFHQAGYSRGEYLETAPKFNQLGYNCLAIDQRSGNKVNNVINQTNLQAKKLELATQYADAMPDLESAIKYIHKEFNPEKLIILGSSYSATLSLILASKYPNMIDAALSFSPGEYFKFNDKMIKDFASEIKIPVFITSAKSEEGMWTEIFEAIPSKTKMSYVPQVESIHGSRALWEANEGFDQCWEAVKEFLKSL